VAAPVYGSPPVIRQEGASLAVVSNAGWFTQGGDRATRYVHVWYWNSTNVFSTPAPPWRSRPEDVQPGEGASRLPLGPTNVGGSFWVVEFGGVDSDEADDGHWVEWGRELASDRAQASGARSNTVTVEPWGAPPPPPPPPSKPSGDDLAHDSLVLAKKALVAWEDAGVSKAQRELTTAWVTVHEKTATAVVKKEIRRLLGAGS
jgi:hypothetical protein